MDLSSPSILTSDLTGASHPIIFERRSKASILEYIFTSKPLSVLLTDWIANWKDKGSLDKSFIKKIGEMDLVPGHIHPYTVIISERDETIYVTVESGEVQGWVEGDRQEINTSDGNTITGVEPGDVQWDGGNTQTIVSQGGRSISMELYDN